MSNQLLSQNHQQHDQQQQQQHINSTMLPEFQINFNIQTDYTDKDMIELPLYSNSSREHLICTLKLCTTVGKEAIILSGVALIVPDVVIK